MGSRLRALLKPIYPELRLSDIRTPLGPRSGRAVRRGGPRRARRRSRPRWDGMEGIIHLGGHSVEGPWETILQANIVGCYNLFEAARRKGVKAHRIRLLQPRCRLLSALTGASAPTCTVRPGLAATASARRSARRWARSTPTSTACACCACRIGNVGDKPHRQAPAVDLAQARGSGPARAHRARASRAALRDLLRRLVCRALLVGQLRALQVTATVRPAVPRITGTPRWRRRAKQPPDPVGDFFQGGTFCSAEFTGDTGRTWD